MVVCLSSYLVETCRRSFSRRCCPRRRCCIIKLDNQGASRIDTGRLIRSTLAGLSSLYRTKTVATRGLFLVSGDRKHKFIDSAPGRLSQASSRVAIPALDVQHSSLVTAQVSRRLHRCAALFFCHSSTLLRHKRKRRSPNYLKRGTEIGGGTTSPPVFSKSYQCLVTCCRCCTNPTWSPRAVRYHLRSRESFRTIQAFCSERPRRRIASSLREKPSNLAVTVGADKRYTGVDQL